jgi:hypothetical protein
VTGGSWEQVVNQVVVQGRPADVESASLDWAALLENIQGVVDALKKNVGDLAANSVWSGPAAEVFNRHVTAIADGLAHAAETARSGTGPDGMGIARALGTAASQLEKAQADMPVPTACIGDIMAARHGHLEIGVGLFKAKLGAGFVDAMLSPATTWVIDNFVNNQEGEARQVYQRVDGEYATTARHAPNAVDPKKAVTTGRSDLALGASGNAPAGVGGGLPSGSNLASPATAHMPSAQPTGDFGTGGLGRPGQGSAPDVGAVGHVPTGGGLAGVGDVGAGALGNPSPGMPGAGSVAGAGVGLGAVGSAGASVGGLPVRAVPGKGNFGGVPKGIPGGGSLGKPVSPNLATPIGGAGAAGAGGRGATTKGRSAGAGRGPSVGALGAPAGGHGGRRNMDEADRSTWLVEDEDVWGIETDAAPPVLRGED